MQHIENVASGDVLTADCPAEVSVGYQRVVQEELESLPQHLRPLEVSLKADLLVS